MPILKLIFLLLIIFPIHLFSDVPETNVLLYKDPVQVTSSINEYENVVAGKPIQGIVMVTHDSNALIDQHSFRLGDKPLNVEFVNSNFMSPYSNLVVTIFSYQLPGMTTGAHTLPPINVKVGGKVYNAPPMTILIN